MTQLLHDGPRLWEPVWHMQQRRLEVRGAEYRFRLVRFEAGWLASVDTESGPTLGMDRSPYLAARRALEPIGIGMVEAMTLLGRIRTD
jgi:hypothetical protein